MAAEGIRETEQKSAPAAMEEYMATPYYQSAEIERLEQQLAGYNADDETLRRQAEAQYAPGYESEVESLKQQLEKQIQGYDSQKAGVSASYDRMRRQTEEAYDESAADLNNQLTKRGLGRSSLVSTQGAYLENKRNQALSDIGQDESAAIAAINEKIALLTDQAAQSERTLAGNYARQLESRVNELKEKNRSASVSLQLQIAALQQQGYEAYQEWLMKEKEFEKKYPTEIVQSGTGGSKQTGSGKQTSTQTASVSQQKIAEQAQKMGSALTTLLKTIRDKLTSAGSGAKTAKE